MPHYFYRDFTSGEKWRDRSRLVKLLVYFYKLWISRPKTVDFNITRHLLCIKIPLKCMAFCCRILFMTNTTHHKWPNTSTRRFHCRTSQVVMHLTLTMLHVLLCNSVTVGQTYYKLIDIIEICSIMTLKTFIFYYYFAENIAKAQCPTPV